MSNDPPRRKPGDKRNEYAAPALEKGLDILELLASESDGLNVSQVAVRLERSVGEIFRMVVVLDRRGYIRSRDGSGAYSITLKLFQLAHRLPAIERLTTAAAPELKSLAHAIGQSCHVVIYYDGRGHIIAQQDAPSERSLRVRLGAEAPLLNTCSGHVLLAFASSHERKRMLEKLPMGYCRPKAALLTKLVERVRQQGYETTKSAQIEGVQDIGFPIFDHSGDIAATLVSPFLAYLDDSNPIGFEAAKDLTGQCAHAISEALGHIR